MLPSNCVCYSKLPNSLPVNSPIGNDTGMFNDEIINIRHTLFLCILVWYNDAFGTMMLRFIYVDIIIANYRIYFRSNSPMDNDTGIVTKRQNSITWHRNTLRGTSVSPAETRDFPCCNNLYLFLFKTTRRM